MERASLSESTKPMSKKDYTCLESASAVTVKAPPPYVLEEPDDTAINSDGTQDQVPPSTPLSLTLDKELIYPSIPPSQALYTLSYSLESTGNSISIEASIPGRLRPDGTRYKSHFAWFYELLYDGLGSSSFMSDKASNSTFSIVSHHKSAYPGTGTLKLQRHGLSGKSWELSYPTYVGKKMLPTVVLKAIDGCWYDASGTKLAEETNEAAAKEEKKKLKAAAKDELLQEQLPMLIFEEGLEEVWRGLLVAAWCAKTWYALSHERRAKKISMIDAVRTKTKDGRMFLS